MKFTLINSLISQVLDVVADLIITLKSTHFDVLVSRGLEVFSNHIIMVKLAALDKSVGIIFHVNLY